MPAKKNEKGSTKKGRMILPGRAGPQRKHYCPEHEEVMSAVKVFGRGMMWSCPKNCRLPAADTILK